MGSSKTYRAGPSWQGNNTNRGPESAYSKGGGVKYEGTIMSGGEEPTRKVKSSARDKSKSHKSGGPY